MSRSYKKHPYCGDSKGKNKKAIANNIVNAKLKENSNELLKGGRHKKMYNSWNICDYGWQMTWEEYWKDTLDSYLYWLAEGLVTEKDYPNEKEEYRKWLKVYHNK